MTEETTKVEKTNIIEQPPLTQGLDLIVLAKNPVEMANSQVHLITWGEKQIQLIQTEIDEATENFEAAKKAKYKTAGWRSVILRAEKRKLYYEKILAALRAGFFIIPDFPTTTIAVRTDLKHPKHTIISHKDWAPNLPGINAKELPVGKGKYVNPDAHDQRWTEKHKSTNRDGKEIEVVTHFAQLTSFDEVDFPFRAVKPQVLNETNRAMLLKIFDEICVLPQVARKKQPDPIVTGRIIRREGPNSIRKINFMIYWWINTRDL